MSQGSLQATNNNLDVALQGNGFFVVNNGFEDLYTRAGAFSVDDQGFLVDASSGFRVQRFTNIGEGTATSPAFQVPSDNRIHIPYGTGVPGKATTSITLQGNLSANASGPVAQTLTSAQPFTVSGGGAAALTTPLNSLADSNGKYAAGDSILIKGTTINGTPVSTSLPWSAGPPETTLGDLVNAITGAFPGSTASLDASGNLVLQANAPGAANSLSLTLSDASTNKGAITWTNQSLVQTTAGKAGDTTTSAIQVFDTQGTGHTLSLTFQKQSNNVWNLTASIPSTDGSMVNSVISGITFNDDGSFRGITGQNTALSFQINGLTQPQTVSLNFGTANGFNGITQFGGSSSAAATSQDGSSAGFLSSLTIGKEGLITGIFTNGLTLSLAQLAIANFSNPAGLDRRGENYFALSAQSGAPLVGSGDSGGRGAVQQGALETSNVDVAQEFTQLIIAQRGYEVNSKTISVSDQVLQDLTNIIR
jgi:flagellar hook protein FlgE